jgi:hypothetical protein
MSITIDKETGLRKPLGSALLSTASKERLIQLCKVLSGAAGDAEIYQVAGEFVLLNKDNAWSPEHLSKDDLAYLLDRYFSDAEIREAAAEVGEVG